MRILGGKGGGEKLRTCISHSHPPRKVQRKKKAESTNKKKKKKTQTNQESAVSEVRIGKNGTSGSGSETAAKREAEKEGRKVGRKVRRVYKPVFVFAFLSSGLLSQWALCKPSFWIYFHFFFCRTPTSLGAYFTNIQVSGLMIASGGKCWAIFQTISLHVITAAIKCKNASDKMNSHYPTKSIIGLVSAFRKYYAEIPSFIWKFKVFNVLSIIIFY